MPEPDTRRTVDAVWKLESARIIAGLTRLVRDVGLAEELAQDALVAALEQWPRSGVPDNPAAWLTTTARRRAVDHIRRSERLTRGQERLARELEHRRDPEERDDPEQDDVLRLMLISCHPVLPTEARVALTLRLLGGLTAEEIGRAFLVGGTVITRRVAAAKRTLAERRVPFELPEGPELAERLSSVREVIYLIFNEGYSATSGDDLIRPGLCLEALRLGRLLAELAPQESEVHALVALMEIQASRAAARTGPSGEPVRLHEQNRGRWDQLLIRRGFTAMLRAREAGGTPGPYLLQAAIAVCHAQARTAEDTDWARIAELYAALARLLPTPVVQLNRAVALGMAYGPQAGLDLVDSLVSDPALRDYHLLPGVRGDLLLRLGRGGEARREFHRAAALTGNAAERAFLLRRAAGIAVDGPSLPTLGEAVRDFLGRDELDAATVRSYGQTLRRLRLALGEELPLAGLTAEQVSRVFAASWGGAAAGTWNRHRAAVRSFGAWASLDGLAAGLERRAGTRARVRALDPEELGALWGRTDLPLRERTLWRLLHESAAGVKAVLALDVEDLDLDDRRVRPDRGRVSWRSGAAALLPELLAGRTRGPVFLSDRRPGPARTPGPADLCPETGRRRLSYERAEYLFKAATRSLDPAHEGWTLRQLKPRP
ncbi:MULTISPECIES: RNA polymerase sigma factor [Streptomyces]|uniref:RNA polymerase sigma-70 factor, ECF subfamily n=1 Tax=Streptomyces venezuelae (strain ATCC 10712 / CBS 650.69 / DSM 40230 / JCM 4526 / NBRC 13096 / PD 04745) TaxID=953739 RepID=F2RLN7_STRVP|nr:RNA polymerase sigma factor [Streptomyces venezuelae]APE25740.1 RNA polymerase subunit sigma [Streptomyces venezuelae]QES03077.1 RNA polymerase sigma factor [Streptomyces venezuelae ATCC 10712]CCA60417.1 RNA polymerase sigma-70 factor, ECF subfamily [Streptomyces venezuelae ATCC 10712]